MTPSVNRTYDPVCHCGETWSKHSVYCGHDFVEMGTPEGFDYYADRCKKLTWLVKEIRTILSKSWNDYPDPKRHDVDGIDSRVYTVQLINKVLNEGIDNPQL